LKATIQKQLSEGETIVIEVEAKNPEELAVRLALTWPVLEQRPRELSDRVRDAHAVVRSFPAEIQQAIHATLGLLFGKQGSHEQLNMAKEVIDRNAADFARLKATYEPEAAQPAVPTEEEPTVEEIEAAAADLGGVEEAEPVHVG